MSLWRLEDERAESRDWIRHLEDAERETWRWVDDLTDEQWAVPFSTTVNPILWEVGHLAWFWERWCCRELFGDSPIHPDGDRWWNSSEVVHKTRWSLDLPDRAATRRYYDEVTARVRDRLAKGEPSPEARRLHALALFHEDMHAEAFAYTRQALAFSAPPPRADRDDDVAESADTPPESPLPDAACDGDVELGGGEFDLGATPDHGFVLDNEKWAHPVTVAPFRLARRPVTEGEFAKFVEDGGYRTREWWSDEGWAWRERESAEQPIYWRREGGAWAVREFDRWRPIDAARPMVHVNAHEAEAFAAAIGRRLPTEAEWEFVARGGANGTPDHRRYPWGDTTPTRQCANLEGDHPERSGNRPAGRGEGGCLALLGDVWEWTSSTFDPYPGFATEAYRDYSRPWFGTRRVLRGGAWVTRARLMRNTWRNFYVPERRDIFSGFRTAQDAE